MLTLYASPASPFVRKVRIAASLLGLDKRLNVIACDTVNPDDAFKKANPLGKIPTLILEDGEALYDSRVIVEYLDELAEENRLTPTGKERFTVLRKQALTDGIMDAAILIVYERRFRAEENYDKGWVARQHEKIERSLAYAEANLCEELPEQINIGHVSLACALGFLDLRFDGKWRQTYPKLVAWLDQFSARVPSYKATAATV
jgi:glutathione S-transferase